MKKIIYFFIVFFLIYGLIELAIKIFPIQINSLLNVNSTNKYVNNNKKTILEKCKVKKIDYIPKNSVAIIGHAYGSWEKSNDKSFISQKVIKFLDDNSDFLSKVILTGDVFYIPSLKKWKKLNSIYKDKFDILIAPGNHDFYKPLSRIYFLLSPFGKSKFPYLINFENRNILVDDSVTSQWLLNKETIGLINDSKISNIIVARHNVPITELIDYSNSLQGMSQRLISFVNLTNEIPLKEVTWLIGDGMSIKCFKKNNHKFIINGVSDLSKDTILISHKTQVYQYSID